MELSTGQKSLLSALGAALGLGLEMTGSQTVGILIVAGSLGWMWWIVQPHVVQYFSPISTPPTRSHIWLGCGWGVVFILGLVWLGVIYSPSVETTRPPDALAKSQEQLSEQLARLKSRGITPNQRQKMVEVLRVVPPGVTYKLMILFPTECGRCFDYVNGLLSAWNGLPGWNVQEHRHPSLSPQFEGIWVDTGMKECPPEEVRLIERTLRAADIEPRLDPAAGDRMGFPPGVCLMLVGNKT